MSIKFVHIIFIVLSVLCSLAFSLWAVQYFLYAKKGIYLAAGIGAALFAAILVVYGGMFYQKIKASNL